MKKVGLILTGENKEAIYTAGVIETLMEKNIKVDCIIGVGEPTIYGLNYFSNQPKRVIEKLKTKKEDLKNNLSDKTKYKETADMIDGINEKKFISSKKDFYVSVTNIDTLENEFIQIASPKKQIEELEISRRMPPMNAIKIEDKKYITGILSNPEPVEYMKSLGISKVIIVDTKPMNYRRKPFSKPMSILFKIKYFKNKKLVDRLDTLYKSYPDRLREVVDKEMAQEVFIIRPLKKLVVEKDNLEEIYNLGKEQALKQIDGLKEYINLDLRKKK